MGHTSPPGRSWPWKVSLFLLAATALSYLDRQSLSVVGPLVKTDLRLSNADLGRLFAAFFWTYGLMHVVVGHVLDRSNIRYSYAMFVALWSLSQVGAGFSHGFASLYAARLCLGTFEAAGQIGGARIIARILPAESRTMANGLMMSGGSLGALLAPLLMISLAERVGWRLGFAVLGLLGLVWSVAWLAWFRSPALEVRTLGAADRWADILAHPKFWACVGGAACTIPLLHVMGTWVPTYLNQAWGLSTPSQKVPLLCIALGLDLGFLGGGALVSGLTRRGYSVARARLGVMLVATALMGTVALIPLAPNAVVAVGLFFLLHVGRAAWGATFLAFNQDVAPGRVATVAGVMGCIGACAGAALITLIGRIAEQSGFAIVFPWRRSSPSSARSRCSPGAGMPRVPRRRQAPDSPGDRPCPRRSMRERNRTRARSPIFPRTMGSDCEPR